MNAINDNNDPFEDIFRDRFADFESEPSEILWNKIEPQLPVNPTRRSPYWQISAVILGLFLGGFYFTRDVETSTISAANVEKNTSKNMEANGNLPSRGNLPYLSEKKEIPSVVSVPTDNLKETSTISKTRTSKNTETEGMLPSKGILPYLDKASFIASNNITKIPSNPSEFQQSNLINTDNSIAEPSNKNSKDLSNSGNIFESNNVSVGSNQSIVEREMMLSILDSKSYGLLPNHFKNTTLKFVTVPKEEVYFKEKKPLEFYFSAMPLLNYYTITPNGNDANFVHSISVNDDGDRIGFYTQAGLVFTLSDRFKLRTGLTFTKTNHSINYQVRTDSLVVQPADNKGVDVSFADLSKTYSQSANYLSTKIEVQYIFLQGEALTHYVSIGGEASYRLNSNHELNGFANFAYGITRQIGDNAYLFVEPTFSYSLNQQSDNSSLLLVKPNKIGFNIGVNFKIK